PPGDLPGDPRLGGALKEGLSPPPLWRTLFCANCCPFPQDGKLGPGDLLPGQGKDQGGIAMNVPCGLIQDLLPLYYDEVCSQESRSLVEEHLAECPACRQRLADLSVPLPTPEKEEETV